MRKRLLELNKKQAGSLILAFTMASSLVACSDSKDTTTTTTGSTTTTAVETTIESTTVETTLATETAVVEELKYEKEANDFYNENKDYFVNQYGNNKEYAIKEINDAILVLTNESETVTNEDLRNTFYALDNMFMPLNVTQAAGNYITNEPIEKVENVPNLSRYISDPQAQKLINENTIIINNFINALNSGNKDEMDKAKKLLLQREITMEENLDEYYYLGELSNGDELALNYSNKALTNLAGSLVKNGVLNYTDKNGVEQTMFLIPDTRGAAILNTFRFAEEAGAPFDEDNINGVKVYGRYIEYLGANGFVKEFVTQAEKNTLEDTLVITKYDEVIRYMQNEYSRLSAEYHALNSDCNYTLTK
jgi:hypothetical protein